LLIEAIGGVMRRFGRAGQKKRFCLGFGVLIYGLGSGWADGEDGKGGGEAASGEVMVI
jgi:hypothetical protein